MFSQNLITKESDTKLNSALEALIQKTGFKSILIVDDEKANREAAEQGLTAAASTAGIQLYVSEGVDQFHKDLALAQKTGPVLVLSDLRMPYGRESTIATQMAEQFANPALGDLGGLDVVAACYDRMNVQTVFPVIISTAGRAHEGTRVALSLGSETTSLVSLGAKTDHTIWQEALVWLANSVTNETEQGGRLLRVLKHSIGQDRGMGLEFHTLVALYALHALTDCPRA